ncbi:hypothetical protein ABT297_31365 [Dactylosporangium sp. NPDC000555]|uniref:hypothetical protein n=1 Tax=Dactylosporangium sp. NPDC000555 TaxID=3154260 RepID=UPI0033198B66
MRDVPSGTRFGVARRDTRGPAHQDHMRRPGAAGHRLDRPRVTCVAAVVAGGLVAALGGPAVVTRGGLACGR